MSSVFAASGADYYAANRRARLRSHTRMFRVGWLRLRLWQGDLDAAGMLGVGSAQFLGEIISGPVSIRNRNATDRTRRQ
jgi:hypothetical protein